MNVWARPALFIPSPRGGSFRIHFRAEKVIETDSMEKVRQQPEPSVMPGRAGAGRSARLPAARRLIFLIFALCLPAAGQTADSYGDLVDRQFDAQAETSSGVAQ